MLFPSSLSVFKMRKLPTAHWLPKASSDNQRPVTAPPSQSSLVFHGSLRASSVRGEGHVLRSAVAILLPNSLFLVHVLAMSPALLLFCSESPVCSSETHSV